MPALADLISARTWAALSAVQGQTLSVLTGAEAGNTFTGILLVSASVELVGELGPDAREKTIVHFATSGAPALAAQDRLSVDGTTWRVVDRVSNPADLTVDYELTKVVSGKDT